MKKFIIGLVLGIVLATSGSVFAMAKAKPAIGDFYTKSRTMTALQFKKELSKHFTETEMIEVYTKLGIKQPSEVELRLDAIEARLNKLEKKK